MTPTEQQIEKMLRARLADIVPPHSLFLVTTENVTKDTSNRYLSTSLWRDYVYSFSPFIFMKNSFVIGALAVVLIGGSGLWYVFGGSSSGEVAALPTPVVTGAQPSPTDVSSSLADAASPAQAPISPDTNVDTLGSDIETSGRADATVVAGESTDSDTVNADLTNYSDAKTTSYDDTL